MSDEEWMHSALAEGGDCARIIIYSHLTDRYADALIAIAAGFKQVCPRAPMEPGDVMVTLCRHCGCMNEYRCVDWCPGLKARIALGIA